MTIEIPLPQLMFLVLSVAQTVYFIRKDLKRTGRDMWVGLTATVLVMVVLQTLFTLGGWYDTTHIRP